MKLHPKTRIHSGIVVATFLMIAQITAAQIISSDRLVTWQGNVGVPGGIPNVTTIYANIPAGSAESVVQSALNSCPSNQVVLLAAGTYTWSANLDWGNVSDGVVLRGAGPNTVITYTDSGNPFLVYNGIGEGPLSVDANLSVDAVKGGNTLTLAAVPSWVTVGGLIGLDQLDDSSFVSNSGYEANGFSYREQTGNGPRGLAQLNRVLAKTATTITLETPLYYGFKVSQTAQIFQPFFDPSAHHARYRCGIENMKLVGAYSAGTVPFILFEACDSCWVKNVEIYNQPGKAGVLMYGCYHCEVRHCTIHSSQNQSAGEGYGVAFYHFCGGCLGEDNIFYDLHSCGVNMQYGSSGNVSAYNYELAGYTNGASPPQCASMNTHGTHAYMNLWEGNYSADKVLGDWTHGSSSHNTIFRCRVQGNNGGHNGAIDELACVSVEYYNRYWNIVGNILGTAGVQDTYLCDSSHPSQGSGAIIKVGGELNNNLVFTPSDANSYTTGSHILIHGNWDSVQNQQTWEPAVASHTLANSYVYGAKPSYWGSLAWPPFDPANPGAAAPSSIPAGYRYVHGVDPPTALAPPMPPANLNVH